MGCGLAGREESLLSVKTFKPEQGNAESGFTLSLLVTETSMHMDSFPQSSVPFFCMSPFCVSAEEIEKGSSGLKIENLQFSHKSQVKCV